MARESRTETKCGDLYLVYCNFPFSRVHPFSTLLLPLLQNQRHRRSPGCALQGWNVAKPIKVYLNQQSLLTFTFRIQTDPNDDDGPKAVCNAPSSTMLPPTSILQRDSAGWTFLSFATTFRGSFTLQPATRRTKGRKVGQANRLKRWPWECVKIITDMLKKLPLFPFHFGSWL